MLQIIEFKNHKKETLRGLLDKADSETGVIFVHGFERTSLEYKFKNIADKLKKKASLFHFDFSGGLLSDGSFEDITAEKLSKELDRAVEAFKPHCSEVKNIVLVAHSFGCCVVLKYLAKKKDLTFKTVFLAPAFNQKELNRYWFASSVSLDKEITWNNFKESFSHEEFEKMMEKPKRMSKAHYISNEYFLENKEADYQDFFESGGLDFEKMLVVHGDKDDKVPFESNDKLSGLKGLKQIKVEGGNHDLQRPDMVEQYLEETIDFILS